MSKKDKLLKRILSVPADVSYEELKNFLSLFNFEESQKGKTSGSRVAFCRKSDKRIILIHKPHPENIIGRKALRAVIEKLEEFGDL